LASFFQVVFIDIALAGDNAVVIAMAALGLPKAQRGRAIAYGILAATVLRIGFASVAVQLLHIVGLALAGGVLLLWVCWKMWREMHPYGFEWRTALIAQPGEHASAAETGQGDSKSKTLKQATFRIIVADVSMSLDNVLAVAGASREHPIVLVFGLSLSIALMGCAAVMISKLLQKHRWIAYAGLAIILYVALDMILHGGQQVWPTVAALI